MTTPHDGPSIEEIANAHGIPWPLAKASVDPFEYAVGLRDGTVVHFEHCRFDVDPTKGAPTFVTLLGVKKHSIAIGKDMPIFERGLVVRIVDVLWAADAPDGS